MEYRRYQRLLDSHPKYLEEWNEFCMVQYYKLGGAVQLTKSELTPLWEQHWKKRLAELKDEEYLECRINLRKKLNLPLEDADLLNYQKIHFAQKIKIKTKRPTVPEFIDTDKMESAVKPKKQPLINLDEISLEIDKKLNNCDEMPQREDIESEQAIESIEVIDSTNTPSNLITLTNDDLLILFQDRKNLSTELFDDLFQYVSIIEMNNPDRYHELMNSTIASDDKEEDSKDRSSVKIEEDDDEDDYPLDQTDLMECAMSKSMSVKACADEEDSGIQIIDLTKE